MPVFCHKAASVSFKLKLERVHILVVLSFSLYSEFFDIVFCAPAIRFLCSFPLPFTILRWVVEESCKCLMGRKVSQTANQVASSHVETACYVLSHFRSRNEDELTGSNQLSVSWTGRRDSRKDGERLSLWRKTAA